MKQPLKIVITTGDFDGIGTEITAKALAKLKPQKGVHFILWRTPRCPRRHLQIIDSCFTRIRVSTWPEALKVTPTSNKELVDISSNLQPPKWIELAAKSCLFGYTHSIATAPISKKKIVDSGLNVIGHTEILKKVSKAPYLFMAFVGKHFNILIITGHLAHKKVASKLTQELVLEALIAANRLRKLLPKKKMEKPIALIGLNPHAGEGGLIGSEDENILVPAIKNAKDQKIPVHGPLVPDTAFFKENWSKYSIFVCPYHDQGLIPFKMVHGQDSGVHITMGLPFVRTSVDHGTAKNIFGKNQANPNSMIEAIRWAILLTKKGEHKSSSIV